MTTEEWLDAYELELLERDLKESPHPRVLFQAWFQKWVNGTGDQGWYDWDEEQDSQ